MPSPVAVVIAAVTMSRHRNVRLGPNWPTGLGRCRAKSNESTGREGLRVPGNRLGSYTFLAALLENRAPAGPPGEGRQLWRPGVDGPTSE